MSKILHLLRNLKLGSLLGMIILVVIWSTPTLGLLITSLRPSSLADISPWWEALFNPLSTLWTLDAYQNSLSSGMLDSLINTIAVTIPATILPLMIAANAAYAFTFLNFKGKEFFFAVLVALMVIPLQSSLIPVLRGMVWFQKAVGIPLTGTYASAWVVHSAFAMPLAIYILRNYMMTLPRELIEAAKVDGASNYQIFWQLVLPVSVPALASFAIFQFLWVWNDYLIAFIFVGEQKAVMTYRLLRLLGQYGQGWRDVAAGSFISLIIPLIVFFALQRYFVRGLLAGSVKG
ncbi:MAG: sugar ABC transporter permease [Anaerolineae bacterium CG_4_9_14_3_um_filter_57_17]|nr:carbohydrate ABC transporter permease [bacterium]NCT22214.1 carbohydrate ABC transporter permease [bacterium]OIO87225.1 MAG: sugar ABC transporter permease [Anaerolineae bacterium CG2_30_57_67]PJB64146.1 MAG: sugar ABC transporter permease [Anaerolineae bacterium CG_4_9_14_3_um_filter_57_17]